MLAQNDPETAPEDKEPKEPPKSMSKLVRVMTVFAYLSSVSMAAVLLSIYYLCIWKSPVLSDLDANVDHQHGDPLDYQTGDMKNDSDPYMDMGGSSVTVNDSEVQLPPSSIAYPDDQGSSEASDTTTENTEPTTLSNSTAHHNGTTEATESFNDTSTIVQSSITV